MKRARADAAVVGSPFLDLVFDGLPRLPAPGEEVVARGFRMVPGGTAIQAIGLARLGVSTALVSPRGADTGGRLITDVLGSEGVRWTGRRVAQTPTTAILSTPDGTAMATAAPHDEPSRGEVASIEASTLILSLGRADLRPPGVPTCLVSGSLEVQAGVAAPEVAEPGDAIVVNANEAFALTGEADPEDAARALARGRRVAVVTIGADGAVGVEDGRAARARGPEVELVDSTGAGDLFVAAFVWARLRGLDLDVALAWSCLSATLSVRERTALDGALRLDDLLREGRSLGLSPP